MSEEEIIWHSYSDVYELLDNVPFVKYLQRRHIAAMNGHRFILDAGCGPGLITKELAKYKEKVVAIDLNDDMLKNATQHLRNFNNVQLQKADVCDLPFPDNTFDGCISNNVLHFVDDADKFFSEMIRVVKPGGILSIASARPCCDMEILIKSMNDYFISKDADKDTMNKVEQIAAANRELLKGVKSVYEPQNISKILLKCGCQSILHAGVAYLKQSFHVVAKK